MNRIRSFPASACALALLLVPLLAGAQSADSKEVLRTAVANAVTPLLGDSSAPIVRRLGEIKPDGALSRNFDVGAVSKAVFGRSAVNVAPDCKTTSTPTKEPDGGRCLMDSGQRESPTGAYIMLSFDKNIGIGDITFARRAAFDPATPKLPPAVKLTDEGAYDAARKFLDLVGVPRSEIPQPPPGVRNPFPVRTMVIGSEADPGKDPTRIEVQKVVTIQRAFFVQGLFTDKSSGQTLNHVIAPGTATVALTDGGVQFADIRGWSDAQMDSKLDPSLAKSTQELVDEITDDLWGEGVRKVGSLSILIALRNAYPNPDDPNPPLCPVCGVLRPALRVVISQAGINPGETSEKAYVAPGLVKEYDLVAQTEAESPAR